MKSDGVLVDAQGVVRAIVHGYVVEVTPPTGLIFKPLASLDGVRNGQPLPAPGGALGALLLAKGLVTEAELRSLVG